VAAPLMKSGTVARDVDHAVDEFIRKSGATPSFKNYPNAEGAPFPGSVCFSVDEEVVHGIPDGRVLHDGSIVGLDIGVYYRGFHVDSAMTFAIGEIDGDKRKLMTITEEALRRGIAQAKIGNHVSDISNAIQVFVEAQGCGIVKELVGHGVGRHLHEDPQIPNFGPPHRGPILRRNMTLAIEPMINLGTGQVDMIGDWQVLTRDRKPSAHFEHTVVITEGDAEIITQAH
jgi:methionyl aminopeptidase